MNTAFDITDPAHLRERADALEAQMNGKTLQYLRYDGEWRDRERNEPSALDSFNRYRPKPWTLPEPPAGMRWHKPEAITEEMHKRGYRPLYVGEEYHNGDEYFSNLRRQWDRETHASGVIDEYTSPCRTLRPLPSLMPGPEYHNPDQVSLAQVGEGYRLLTKEEYEWCKNQNQVQAGVESWWNGEWDKTEWKGCNVSYTYRVPLNWQPSKPAPQPEPRPWDCAEDVLAGWIRSKSDFGRSYLILQICAEGIWTSNEAGNQLFTWGRIAAGDLQHSIDLRTWQPCRKSTEAQP